MGILSIILIVVLIIVALILIAIVLLQDDGGEGLGGIFGGGGNQQVGTGKGNPITRITALLATTFIVTVLALGWLERSPGSDNVEAAARALLEEDEAVADSLRWWEEEIDPDSNLLDELILDLDSAGDN